MQAPGQAALERHPEAPAPGEPIPSHYHRCYGCGEDVPHGLHVAVRAGEDLTVQGEFLVTDQHQGAPGLAHGGLLACAFDEVLGSLVWLVRRPLVTGRLTTEFRRPVPVGTVLHVSARVDAIEGRKVRMSAIGRADAADGPVAVRAEAVFVEVPMDHFRNYGRREDVAAAAQRDETRHMVRALEVNP